MDLHLKVSLLLLLLQFNLLTIVFGLHFMYEHFRQINGTELADARSLRIRKLNRTTSAMNGTVYFKVAINLFHSSLGNNQFNYYPMKIPSIGMCDFVRDVYPTYYPYLKEGVFNCPPTAECPLSPRDVYVRDYVVSQKLIPPFVPKGLWLVRLTVKRNDEAVIVTETMSKLYLDHDW
ncbi:uncharacterized protein LOC5572841 isoform X2 [Aedes aegypti]|uniref:Uncharacterized protein n=1 Tax=Aedes aegypti TaxID=7159 RepID=A0A1S4FPC3_AEDAE|nr:uncharacterized protein LOC5572841 isoform X2 [Aedes aegypti]